MPVGIIQCFVIWKSICWEYWLNNFRQLIRCILDLFVIILALIQLIIQCKAQFSIIRIKYWFYLLIVLSALTNLIHQLLFSYLIFFNLSTLFFDLYFVFILYYAGIKLIQETNNKKRSIIILKIMLSIGIILGVLLFISSNFKRYENGCFGLWFLIVRSIGFFLGIVLCIIVKFHQNRAQIRLVTLKPVQIINNPLPKLWLWVTINIAAQTINLIRTYLFTFVTSLQCEYDKNNVIVNTILDVLVVIITYYIPILSSIWIFWVSCYQKKQKQRSQSYISDPNQQIHMGVQLITIKEVINQNKNNQF